MLKFVVGVVTAVALALSCASTQAAAPPAKNAVLLHGYLQNASTFDSMKADLVAQGYKVYALNLPNNGSKAGDAEKMLIIVTGKQIGRAHV